MTSTPLKLKDEEVAPTAAQPTALRCESGPKDLLAIAWLGGFAEAAVFRKGVRFSPIAQRSGLPTLEAFLDCVDEWILAFGFKGSQASLLIDGGILESSNVALPPIARRLQTNYLREKAKRGEQDKGPLIWESQRIADAKSGPKALLHSFTKSDFGRLSQRLAQRGIALKKALPFMGLASLPFKQIALHPDAATILLAPAGDSHKILALDSKGELQFARDLHRENSRDSQRAAVEINRCLLFARQQFGKPVGQIGLIGDDAKRFEGGIRELLKGEIPIQYFPVTPGFWLQQLVESNVYNLAKESMLQDRKRRWQQSVAMAASLAIGGSLLAFAYQAEQSRNKAAQQIASLQAAEPAMREALESLESRAAEVEQLQAFRDEFETIGRPPIERALIARLSESLPPDTWISEIETEWQDEDMRWRVRLLLTSDAEPTALAQRKEALETALSQAPISLRFDRSPLEKLRAITVESNLRGPQNFVLEGTIGGADPHGS